MRLSLLYYYIIYILSWIFFLFHRCIGNERCDRKWYPVERTYSRQGDQGQSHPWELLQQSDRSAHWTETEVLYIYAYTYFHWFCRCFKHDIFVDLIARIYNIIYSVFRWQRFLCIIIYVFHMSTGFHFLSPFYIYLYKIVYLNKI